MIKSTKTASLVLLTILVGVQAQNNSQVNLAPVIGILSIPSGYSQFPINDWNYMAASYVKYIEGAGARVVPVSWDLPLENLTAIMRNLNGFLITGGSAEFLMSDNKTLNAFGKGIENVINNVIRFNDEGTHYPLWGTCMGYQLISCIIAGQSSGDYNCLYSQPGFLADRYNISFFPAAASHPIFTPLTSDLQDALLNDGITFFNFHYTVKRHLWEENEGLKSNFTRLTYVVDNAGANLTVLIAGIKYPIFGIQFHPEKSPFEWNHVQDIPHSYHAILASQFYASFFVNEARKNFNTFNGSIINLDSALIYNYNPIQITNDTFDQVYFFKRVRPGPPYGPEIELSLQNIDTTAVLDFLSF